MLEVDNVKKAFAYAFPVIVWMGLIFFVSSLSQPPGSRSEGYESTILNVQIVYHFFVFLMLAVLARRAFFAYGVRHATMLAVVFTLGYALMDEVHQTFVPLRAFEMIDLAVDWGGGLMLFSRRVLRLPKDWMIKRFVLAQKE